MRTPDEAPVVVGFNGTAAGLAAIRLGAREAVARDLELRVVHAFTWPRRHGVDYPSARHDATALVDAAVAAAKRSTPRVRVSGRLLDGLPEQVLLRLSRAATLIVLGDDDLAGAPRLPSASVRVQIVARSWCPVVVARGLRPPTGPLLVAVDGSAASLLAVRHAAAEARWRGVAVEVTHVLDRSGPAAEAAGRRLLAAAVAAVTELPAPRTRLLTGDPATTLARASRRARMVLLGARGAGGAVLLGEVAEELLRR
jgi:nucleotide-binding universal stress UspA family protein